MMRSLFDYLQQKNRFVLVIVLAIFVAILGIFLLIKRARISIPQQKDAKVVFEQTFRHENTQFPAKKTENGAYYFHCTPDVYSYDASTIQIGDLTILSTIPCNYINSSGKSDYIKLPALTINYKRNKSVIGLGNEVDGTDLDQRVHSEKFKEFIKNYYQKFSPISKIYVSLDKNEVMQSPSFQFFYPLVDTFSATTLEQFMQTGDSSVLNQRIIPVYNISKNQTYQ